jgi:hypothetical protein
MEISTETPMLQAFRTGTPYTPVVAGEILEPETGDPAVGIRNLKHLPGGVWQIHVNQHGALILFVDGSQYTALGLTRDLLARYASSKGFGEARRLAKFYRSLGRSYTGVLPVIS